ncbi:MAG: LptF/LptG family permease [Planctomycetia bacterium]|nr:LptF/LptG family permease [Planctomycetia bacterium]
MLIDRYVARAQLHAFVIVFVSLAGLTFVVDAFTNLEEFIGHAASAGGLGRVLGHYYGCRLISFFDATSSVIALASAMFALSWLERHNELTALLAAGVDRWRIARPTFVFAAVVSLLAMANRECVLPRIRQTIARNAQDLRGDMAQPFEARYDHRTEILFRGRSVQAGPGRIEAPSLLLPPTLGDHGTSLDAAEAFWRPATEQHPAGYLLRNVSEPTGIDLLPAVEQGGRTVIHTRAGSDWLQPGECFVASDVTFEQLIGSTNWSQYSSTPELVRAVANPALGVGAEIPLRIHARQVQPLLDMALAILGIPLVAGPSRRSIFVAVGWCVGLTVVFFMIVLGCHALATGYMVSPSVGAWMPAVVLLPLAAWMAQPMWE